MDTMRVLMFDFRLEFDCGALMLPVVYTRFQPCPVSQGLRKRVFNVGGTCVAITFINYKTAPASKASIAPQKCA